MKRVLAVLAALTAPLLVSAPAAADEPPVERTAFFAATGVGGLPVGAPAPTANEGDLRVQRSIRTSAPAGDLSTPSEVLAFSALLYRAEGARAELTVTLREGSAGEPQVQACPTVGTDWEAGPNQPLDALAYDCSLAPTLGVPSADGTTLVFGLNDLFQVEPGVWSIALVPTSAEPVVTVPPIVPLPFSVDLAAPQPGDFVTEAAFALPEAPSTGGGTSSENPFTGEGFVGAPSLGGGFSLPGAPTTTGGLSSPVLAGAPAPGAVAAPPTTSPLAPRTAPVLAARPAALPEELSTTAQLLTLAALAALGYAVLRAAGSERPGPQLIGGRARAVAATAGVPAPEQGRPRGIGRFSAVRDAPPRRLR